MTFLIKIKFELFDFKFPREMDSGSGSTMKSTDNQLTPTHPHYTVSSSFFPRTLFFLAFYYHSFLYLYLYLYLPFQYLLPDSSIVHRNEEQQLYVQVQLTYKYNTSTSDIQIQCTYKYNISTYAPQRRNYLLGAPQSP